MIAAARRVARTALAALALPAAVLLSTAGDAPSPALTDQDIVRMVASGMPAERIVKRIRESDGAYDLSPDMIDELRLAGVPDAVIEAMKLKAPPRAGAKESAGAAPPAAAAPRGIVEIDFMDDPTGSPAENSATAPAVAAADPNVTGTVDLAFVVACTHPAHVPDQWDTVSPIDPRTGRHQVLFFKPATVPAGDARKEKGLVYLEHPASWRFEAEPGEHRGFVAVAAKIGASEKYVPIVDAALDRLEVGAGSVTHVQVRLHSTLHGGSRRDPAHPVASNPALTNIGSTATRDWDMRNTILVLKVGSPEPEPSAAPNPAPP